MLGTDINSRLHSSWMEEKGLYGQGGVHGALGTLALRKGSTLILYIQPVRQRQKHRQRGRETEEREGNIETERKGERQTEIE